MGRPSLRSMSERGGGRRGGWRRRVAAYKMTAVCCGTMIATAVGSLEVALEVACLLLLGRRVGRPTLENPAADCRHPSRVPGGLRLDICHSVALLINAFGLERAAMVDDITLSSLSSSPLGSVIVLPQR